MKHLKTLESFLNESDRSKKNRFLGVFGPNKDTFQRILKKVSQSNIDQLIQYTESNGDKVEKIGNNAWGITNDSEKDNQAVWQYSNGDLMFGNPKYPSVYDSYIRTKIK